MRLTAVVRGAAQFFNLYIEKDKSGSKPCGSAFFLFGCGIEVLRKALDAGHDGLNGKFAQRTKTFILDLPGDAIQQLDIILGGFTLVDSFGEVLHPVIAIPAGCAFSTGFVFEEMNGLVNDPIH